MATREQLMALANIPGVGRPPMSRFDLEQAAARGIVPNYVGGHSGDGAGPDGRVLDAPPLPVAPTADQPAPPGTVDLNQPGIADTSLRDKLVAAALADRAKFGTQADSAAAMLGPTGEVAQVRQGALDQYSQAAQEEARIRQETGHAQAGVQADAAKEEAIADRAAQQRKDEFEKRAKELQARADVYIDQAMNTETHSFWADKSTGSRILGILSQTLSGAANGLAGQPGAPSALDKIIDRDLEMQKANMHNKQGGAQLAQNALTQAYNQFGDMETAENIVRQAATRKVQHQLDSLASQMGGDVAPAQAQQHIAQEQQKEAKLQADLAQATVERGDKKTAEANRLLAEEARDVSSENQVELKGQQGPNQLVKLPGIKNPVERWRVNNDWQKTSQRYGSMVASLGTMEDALTDPGFSVEQFQRSKVGSALLSGSARAILGAGANLKGREETDLNSIAMDAVKSYGLSSVADIHKVIRAIRVAVMRNFRGEVQGHYPSNDIESAPGFELGHQQLMEDDAQHAARRGGR